MIEKLAHKTYKITYLDYPNFSSMFIGPKGDCLLQNGVLRQHKFNIKDWDENETRITTALGKELMEEVRKLSKEYL